MALTHSQVLQLRDDLSPFLIHLTRTGTVKLRTDVLPHITADKSLYRTAKDRLERVLATKKIVAISPFGYFNYKVPQTYPSGFTSNRASKVQRQWLRAACFTETPLDHIHIQTQPILGRNLHFESYGLAFTENFIRRNGGSPVMYFASENRGIRDALDSMAVAQNADKFKSIMPFYDSFGRRLYGQGPDVDFRWEREWRTTEDVAFSFTDVAFGLCKTADIQHFETLVGNSFPFVDPVGNAQHIQTVKTRLRTFPHLANLK
jgi:hypothetical protein